MFAVPKVFVDYSEFVTNTASIEWGVAPNIVITNTTWFTLNRNHTHFKSPNEVIKSFAKPLSFSDFSPKNNKLFCYPTNFLYATNNNGENVTYRLENFLNNIITFKIRFAISVGGSGILIPTNYKGQTENIDESITLGKFPTFQWSSDSYTNWLTQNAVNIQNSVINTAINAGSQLASGNAVGSIMSIANEALNLHQSFYEANLLPNKTSGTNTGNVSYSSGKTTFSIKHMRAKKEYLQCLDDFLTRFRLQNK